MISRLHLKIHKWTRETVDYETDTQTTNKHGPIRHSYNVGKQNWKRQAYIYNICLTSFLKV